MKTRYKNFLALMLCISGGYTFSRNQIDTPILGRQVELPNSRKPSEAEIPMRYTKISGTFLNFQNGQVIQGDVQYSSQTSDLAKNQIVIKTYSHGKFIETWLMLEGTDNLDFASHSDDSKIPVITGRFLNSNYDESILSASLPDKNVNIAGAVTKLDETHAISIKTLSDSSTGKIVAVMQERIEIISESEFKTNTSQK